MTLEEMIQQKKTEAAPVVERLETIRVIEYILDRTVPGQKEIICRCIAEHFEQVCTEYETVISNVQKQKQNCLLRIQERSIYLYNVLMTIIGTELGRKGE